MQDLKAQCRLYALTLANLSEVERGSWTDSFDQRFIHYSTAIEGNTCTQTEVTIIMQDGLLPADKSLQEVQEVKYHQKAWEYVKQNYKTQALDECTVLAIHKKVLYYEEELLPGEYRKVNIIIRNAEHHPPKAHHLGRYLQEYYGRLQDNWLEPIQKAAYAHAELAKIHPFTDGNGRTSRTVMNYILLQSELPPVALTHIGRAKYFDSLAIYDETGSTAALEELITSCMFKELSLFWQLYAERIPLDKIKEPELRAVAAKITAQ